MEEVDEPLREGVRTLIARALGGKATDGVLDWAERIEEECLRRARADAAESGVFLRITYTTWHAKVCKALPRRYGEFLEWTLAEKVLSGETGLEALMSPKTLEADEAPSPRDQCRAMFYRSLKKDTRLSGEEVRGHARDIEKSCYIEALKQCKASESPPVRSWDSPAFVNVYSSRCGTVNSNLDPESSVTRLHGAILLERLVIRDLEPSALGSMTSAQLCPEAGSRARREIMLRSQQKIQEKSSKLFRCPFCGARNCTYQEVQKRALDEGADFVCTCLECRQQFNGR